MWNRIRTWWQAEGALAGLQGMSDRMLADMGLTRDELRDQVLGIAQPSSGDRDGICRHPLRAFASQN